MTAVEGEINQIYAALIQFFKQNRSDMIQLENSVAKLEQNVNLINWQNSIEYQMLDGVSTLIWTMLPKSSAWCVISTISPAVNGAPLTCFC